MSIPLYCRCHVYDVCISKLSIVNYTADRAPMAVKISKLPASGGVTKAEVVASKNVVLHKGTTKQLNVTFKFDSFIFHYLLINVEQNLGSMCWSQKELLGQGQIELLCHKNTQSTDNGIVSRNYYCYCPIVIIIIIIIINIFIFIITIINIIIMLSLILLLLLLLLL